ncbi:OmpA family protein [Sorangium sp. So ce1036]|uniref:OmpA/MotB family protein n=1 Tax=Sorangium sp. So ce1036 TaxID=3133328 RepID=UPI003F0CD8B3
MKRRRIPCPAFTPAPAPLDAAKIPRSAERSGSAELSPDGQAALKEVASVLKEYEDRQFMVAGHTDNVPLAEAKYRNDWELSTARALTVTEFVIAAGMRPDNLVAAGYGEFDPVSPNNTPSGRQENRRIEIVLLPSVDELPRLMDQQEGPAPAGASIPAAASAAPSAPR